MGGRMDGWMDRRVDGWVRSEVVVVDECGPDPGHSSRIAFALAYDTGSNHRGTD